MTTNTDANTHPGGMRVLETQVYRGPNPYGYYPMIRFKLDLGRLEDYPTSRLEGFTARLVALVPSLQGHGCSYGHPGGFVRRMEEGTWLGHVTEHVALELQTLAGTPVTYGKTRSTGEREGVYNVLYSYREERVGLMAGWLALRLVNSLLPPELQGVGGLDLLVPRGTRPLAEEGAAFDFQAELEALIRLAERLALGPTTRSLVEEAERRGIPAIRLDDESLVQFGYGKYQQRVRASVTSKTSQIAVEAAKDKSLTNRLLLTAGLPIPEGAVVSSAEEAVAEAERLGYPVVTKPLDGNHGRGVSTNLTTPEAVRWGFEQAAAHGPEVIVERHFQGKDYRVLVIGGEVVAVAERVPAHVVGDGEHTVAQLVEFTNADPRRGVGHEKVLTRIKLDPQVERLLEQSGYTLQSVPKAGEVVYLRATANLSTGGTAIDRTDEIHPDNADIARRAALVIGLDVAGIDFVAPDIRRSVRETGGGIVEVNAGPGFRMHLQPSEGRPRNVAAPVLDMLFPAGTPCRIPVVAITGTNGKTTTSRMVAAILKKHGYRVGLTTSTGIYIDDRLYLKGDTTGPKSARVVLCDPTIDAAVLETARGGILREGLGFDRCTVGAVLNVQADHLGLRGVETVEDLAWVKSLVVEVVADDGHSVLNADDPLTYRMRRRAGGRLVLFSMQGGESCPGHLKEHVDAGGVAVVRQPGVKGDLIAVYDGDGYHPVIWAHEIPATLGGAAAVNVQNALAAAAIAYSVGVPVETIAAALAEFRSTFEQNPGRLNVYEGHPFKVVLDYGHNPAGLEPMVELVRRLKGDGRAIGVVSVAGDRRDADMLEVGRIAARTFDEVILREDTKDRRGRREGEIAALLRRGVLEGGMPEGALSVILEETEALQAALRRARPGDLVVHFATEIDEAWRVIREFVPAADAPRGEQPSVGQGQA
ncbi:Cyanophycin synthetase [Calidithermus terrae]|uniref:Cyanophycin synthetase n=2 Tax=Calidithermus terrae TaxID=1408545 RepID=A0A399DYN5_9DEIN|nr:Cyanophycin synthetase [Calidithermus terrae]